MSAHTPGPWVVVRGDDGNCAIADNGIGMVVAWSKASGVDADGCIANFADARLIATAPELLDALMELLGPTNDPKIGWRGFGADPDEFRCEFCGAQHPDCIVMTHADDCPITQARAAIAKATGGQA